MSLYNNIQNALNARLNSVSGLPAVAWPNVEYVPVRGTSYVRPSLLPSNSTLFTLNDYHQHKGIYQVDIFTPLKKGTSPILTIADAIRDHFLADLDLTSGSDTVFIQEISISQPQTDEAWWSCFVQINWLCFN